MATDRERAEGTGSKKSRSVDSLAVTVMSPYG